MTEPDWAKILNYLYQNDGRLEYALKTDEMTEEMAKNEFFKSLRKQVGLESAKNSGIESTLKHLRRNMLINYNINTEMVWINLEPDGFEVAHEREMEKRQEETNNLIAGFTAALVLVAAIEAFATAPVLTPKGSSKILIGGTLFVLAFVVSIVVDPSWFGTVRKWGNTVIHSVGSRL